MVLGYDNKTGLPAKGRGPPDSFVEYAPRRKSKAGGVFVVVRLDWDAASKEGKRKTWATYQLVLSWRRHDGSRRMEPVLVHRAPHYWESEQEAQADCIRRAAADLPGRDRPFGPFADAYWALHLEKVSLQAAARDILKELQRIGRPSTFPDDQAHYDLVRGDWVRSERPLGKR